MTARTNSLKFPYRKDLDNRYRVSQEQAILTATNADVLQCTVDVFRNGNTITAILTGPNAGQVVQGTSTIGDDQPFVLQGFPDQLEIFEPEGEGVIYGFEHSAQENNLFTPSLSSFVWKSNATGETVQTPNGAYCQTQNGVLKCYFPCVVTA